MSYYHLELYKLISDVKMKPKLIGISAIRLQQKQYITKITLPNYVYEHTPAESSK